MTLAPMMIRSEEPLARAARKQPPRRHPRRLDRCSLRDVVRGGQHEYVLDLMAQALADSVEPDGIVGEVIDRSLGSAAIIGIVVRELQARIGALERSLAELRDAVALEKNRALALPALPAQQRFELMTDGACANE